jgi:hypothetical protein
LKWFFFLEQAGELLIISLRKKETKGKKSPHTNTLTLGHTQQIQQDTKNTTRNRKMTHPRQQEP